jgi:hypothetical protein
VSAPSWVDVEVESMEAVGWSMLVVGTVVDVVLGEDEHPLEHRRGRYRRPGG